MRHEIDLKGLQDWMLKERVLFASSSKEQKRLYVTLRGSYEVYHKLELMLETMQPNDAIKRYNEL